MPGEPLAVLQWTESRPLAWSGDALLVFSLATPDTTQREIARQRVRRALRETLAAWLGCSPEKVPLLSPPGLAPKLTLPGWTVGLSVSHAPGISLVAIQPDGPVGIDVQSLAETGIADDEMLRLASDYLGPEAARHLGGLAPDKRHSAFAGAWVDFEARLKCRGEALSEWSPQRQAALEAYRIQPLDLPKGWIGAVATQSAIRRQTAA